MTKNLLTKYTVIRSAADSRWTLSDGATLIGWTVKFAGDTKWTALYLSADGLETAMPGKFDTKNEALNCLAARHAFRTARYAAN